MYESVETNYLILAKLASRNVSRTNDDNAVWSTLNVQISHIVV